MGTKWKKFSHSAFTKTIVFIIAILCLASAVTIFADIVIHRQGDFAIVLEDSYYQGSEFIGESSDIVVSLRQVAGTYKNEEHILSGGTLSEEQLKRAEDNLYFDFERNSKSYNPNLSRAENYEVFKEVYAEKIIQKRAELIQEDLRAYRNTLRRIEQYQGLIYYAKDGETEFTNSPDKSKDYFKGFPACLLFDDREQEVFPEEIKKNPNYHWLVSSYRPSDQQDMIYLAFTDEFLSPRLEKWQQDKALFAYSLNQIAGYLAGLAAALLYLIAVIGRKPGEEREVHFNSIDRIYNDINLVICFSLVGIWIASLVQFQPHSLYKLVFPVTFVIGACGLVFVLSLIKHLKNGTFIKHTLTYTVFSKIFRFIREIYESGSVAIKVVIAVIAYPVIAGLTFFMFPITIGVAVWLAMKRVKEYNTIKEGVRKVREGDIHHCIDIPGNGELAQLAADINGITDGLNKAVESHLQSERLKTELITNVSHDIRTPLTSIITYVDLLKNETDPVKTKEYIDIIDQKSQRLKTLTDDLFEASKASSGNIPVNLEKIDLVSLLTQGLGELDDQIQERRLEFRINHPEEKVFIKADGKLFWRAVENLLSNVFKYALEGSRVYIDIIDAGSRVSLVIKNISAYELNISSDELMERFKRGDESRSSQGSGLGLSIAKSLLELQKGSFKIEIDGDLFKAVIQIPKWTYTKEVLIPAGKQQ